ncbi:MAG TPA: hypothetical protein VKU01_07380 [Bryobacteraceae bacterium]|nr:hypothetical protein [Bryobacteraceae bacterium]
MYDTRSYYCGPNDGGIKRGDRADTGDEEARPTRTRPDEDDDSLGTASIDDLTIHPADDGALGMTDIGPIPPDDWAANTGPTEVAEGDNRAEWEPREKERAKKERAKPECEPEKSRR